MSSVWILVELRLIARTKHPLAPYGAFLVSHVQLVNSLVDIQLHPYDYDDVVMVDVINQLERLYDQ